MKGTRHFAGVIGAAGIIVSPFMAPLAAQADDTLAPDALDYAVEGDANLGNDDVPNLPVTRVVSPGDSVAQEESEAQEDSVAQEESEASEVTDVADDSVATEDEEDYSMPIVSSHAAALDIVETPNGLVVLDVPDEVKEGLGASGEISGEALKGFVVDGDAIGLKGVTFEFDGMNWVMITPVAEGESEGTPPQQEVVSQDVADKLNAYVAQRNAGNVVAAPSAVGVAAPVAEDVADATDNNVTDDVAPAPEAAPVLPVTGDDAGGSMLPWAPLLGITGLVLGGGIGVVTLRKRLELADSK